PAQPTVNVVPFRSPAPVASAPAAPAENTPALTPVERHAFTELATRLTARLRGSKDRPESADDIAADLPLAEAAALKEASAPAKHDAAARGPEIEQRPILDRVPVGVLVY